jgi:hypothetical protein
MVIALVVECCPLLRQHLSFLPAHPHLVDTLLRRPCSVLVEYQTVIARPEPERYRTINFTALSTSRPYRIQMINPMVGCPNGSTRRY